MPYCTFYGIETVIVSQSTLLSGEPAQLEKERVSQALAHVVAGDAVRVFLYAVLVDDQAATGHDGLQALSDPQLLLPSHVVVGHSALPLLAEDRQPHFLERAVAHVLLDHDGLDFPLGGDVGQGFHLLDAVATGHATKDRKSVV